MFEPDEKLRHLPFFEEVANRVEGDPEWHAAVAGLVVLRLVDRWIEERSRLSIDDVWAVRSVEAAIEQMSAGTPSRTLLGRVIRALKEQRPDIHVVVTPLMAYAQALEYEAKWSLAADVYQAVLAHLHPIQDTDASIAAHLRLGSCYRSLNRIEEATSAYVSASRIAAASGDMVGILRARVGESAIAVLRGNLPAAEMILDDTIARAVGDRMDDVRSRALHVRANVAKLRGQYELSIQLAYRALYDSETATERDRILADIAGAFADLGAYSTARDAYLVLWVTAQEPYTRWVACLNLIEIAAQTGSEVAFEEHRRALIGERLPPYVATGLQLMLGTGYLRFGENRKARNHLERAMALATENGFHQFLFEAEEALLGIKTPAPPRDTPSELSVDVQEVAKDLRLLRESVEI